MKFPRWTKRLLDSTRGQVILRLREEPQTVADLASALGVTDNAIRTHLTTLERDGLVRQFGERAGFRKPHFSYELTQEADELFPKAYAPVLAKLLEVMKEQLGGPITETLLTEVGRCMAPAAPENTSSTMEEKLEHALRTLSSMGGQAKIVNENGQISICSDGCPLSAATTVHSEACEMVGALISEVVGVPVETACRKESSPRCVFVIDPQAQAQEKL